MPQMMSNEIQLYYERQGQGPPLLFIHGLGSSTRDWESQTGPFAANYQVITFDLRGHGRSDKPPGPYTLPMFTADTAGLLKGLGLDAVHVVGISLGGGIAFQLAIDYPELVKTLTIVNSAPAMGGSDADAQAEVERRVAIVQQVGMQAMGEVLGPNLFPGPEHAALRQTFAERWAANDPQAYIAATRSMVGWSVLDQIGAIQCPTLVIAADQDYTPVASKEAYIRLMPHAELVVIPNTHHAVPVEKAEEFNAVLAEFLARHS